MRRSLLLFSVLILVSVASIFIIYFKPFLTSNKATAAFSDSTAESENLEKAIRQALEKHKTIDPTLHIFDTQIENIKYSADGRWAIAWLTPLDPQTQQIIPTEPGLALAQLKGEKWQVALPWDDFWVIWAQGVPNDLLSRDQKTAWMELAAPQTPEAVLAPFTGYRLPWKAGETMALTQSVGHDYYTPSGSAHYAFDFAKPGYPSGMFDLYAAKSGEVYKAVWGNPNGDPDHANYLVIRDSTTSPVTYQLYLHLAQDSIPAELRIIGAPVQRGQFIGVADDTGVSSGNHLHFHVHTYPYSYWGTSVDITFEDVTINGGRPRIKSDLPYCNETDICDQTQTYYVSGNVPEDDFQAPTGYIESPLHGSTQYAQSIRLSGWANDAASGLASAQFYSLYSSTGWLPVGPAFSASPFSYDWDACASGVPDGPISLALVLEDYAHNKTDALFGLTHFIKNFSCPSTSTTCAPSTNQVALFGKPDYAGKCVLLNVGSYPSPTSLGSLGEDNAESILIGSSVKATLFNDPNLQGRSETFVTNDANLSDNLVGANTISALLVQTRSTAPATPIPLWPLTGTIFENNASLSLAWKDAGGAASFQARLQGPVQITSTWQTQPTWHLSGLTPGSYTWQVRGKYDASMSAWSTALTFQVQSAQLMADSQAPAASVPYLETFESGGTGWSGNNTWNLTVETNHIPAGTYSIRYQPGGSSGYDTGTPNAGYLTSPPLSLPGAGEYFLRFWYVYTTEGPNIHWDQRWVQISVNGGPFTNLLQLSDEAMDYWLRSPAISLAAYAGQSVQVRFYFATLDALQNNTRGWLVDDFSITTDPPDNCQDNDNNYLQATLIGTNTVTSNMICPGGDVDFYKFQGIQGDHIGIRIDSQTLGSPLDSYLFLLDIDGRSVLAENDDIVLYERTDSYIHYWLNRTGTFYIKLRSWDHFTSGSLSHTYNLHLYRDNDDPITFFTFPKDGGFIPTTLFELTVAATDLTSDISHVKFFWHSGDWYSPTWIELGDDWTWQDGWNYPFDPSIITDAKGFAFYAQVYDWAGNWIGTGAWNLGMARFFLPSIFRLP